MRFLLSTILLAMVLQTSSFSQVSFRDLNWDQARASAKSENKLIFVDAFTDWCGWCKVMDQKTFSKEEVGREMGQYFVPLKLDMETGLGLILARKYQVTGFPSFLVFDHEGKLVYRMMGFKESPEFLEALREAREPSKQLNTKGIGPDLEPKFPEFYLKCFGKGQKTIPKPAEVQAFLEKQSDPFSEISWAVYFRCQAGEKQDSFFIQNREKYRSLFIPDQVEEKVLSILNRRLEKLIENKDEKGLEALLSLVQQMVSKDPILYAGYFRCAFYRETADWTGLARSADQLMLLEGFDNKSYMNELAWEIYQKCENAEVLQKASKWMSHVVAVEPNYAYSDTYAALLWKTGKYPEAKLWAEKAIAAGEKEGEDTNPTKELLAKIEEKLKP